MRLVWRVFCGGWRAGKDAGCECRCGLVLDAARRGLLFGYSNSGAPAAYFPATVNMCIRDCLTPLGSELSKGLVPTTGYLDLA